jgi:predicted component of type VI protein secretion system
MAHLVITSGQLEGRRIEVSRELVVGRENVDVEIDDAELSRRHFAVRPVAGGLEVEDLGSRNGTRVDGTRIDGPTRVRHGAVVTVGVTMLIVELPQEAPASSAGETRAHVSEGTVVGQAPPRPARRPAPPPPAPSAPPAPAPATAPAPAPAPAVADSGGVGGITQPFGRYQASKSSRRRKAATRLWVPQALTYASVAGTAVALIIYFADH